MLSLPAIRPGVSLWQGYFWHHRSRDRVFLCDGAIFGTIVHVIETMEFQRPRWYVTSETLTSDHGFLSTAA